MDANNATQQRPGAFSGRLGSTPATPYQAGFEDFRYRHEWDCPWRGGTSAARDYAIGLADAQRAERAGRV